MLFEQSSGYYRTLFLTGLLSLGILPAQVDAETDASVPDEPEQRWSAGIGVGAVAGPDYRGSKTYRSYVAPIPYIVYRGPVLRSDRDGVRGEFFRSDRIEVNVSLAATVTPDSDKNKMREGMHELKSTLEVGPAININLTGESMREGWALTLPLRAVITLERSPDHIGWLVEPQLVYRTNSYGWHWAARVGPVFATSAYHDYYYTVEAEQALPERPSYSASGGYSGVNSQFAISRRAGNFWYAFFVRYNNIQSAEFVDSPLVETRHGASGGLAISWIAF